MKRTPLRRRSRIRPINPERLEWLRHIQFDGGIGHADYIRKLPCVICHKRPPSVAHHAKTRGSGGRARHMVPLCDKHHKEAHNLGPQSFDRKYLISLLAVAEEFWQAHHRALEAA